MCGDGSRNLIFGAGLIALFSVSLAQASGAMITHKRGISCVEHQDTTPEIYYTNPYAYNNSTASNTFVCPVDSTWSNSFIFDSMGWNVLVRDQNPTEDVACNLRVCNGFYTSCVDTPSESSSGVGKTSLTGDYVSADFTDVALLQCTVPGKSGSARSGIIGYMMTYLDN